MLKLFFIFIFVLLLWHLLTRKYINPYTMDLYIGKKGCGKSTTISKHIIRDIKHGYTVYCNCDDIKINGVRVFNTLDFGKYELSNCVVYIDEISLFFDNRNYKQTSQEFIKFLRYLRHYKIRAELYTQSYDCDKKIRTMCDNIYIMNKWFRVLNVQRRLVKSVAVEQSQLDAESQIVDKLQFTSIFIPHSLQFTFIPKYIKYFDSYKELYKMEKLKYIEVTDGVNIRSYKRKHNSSIKRP